MKPLRENRVGVLCMWPWEWLEGFNALQEESRVILTTGAMAFLVAGWGVLSQRRITRRQVTLEHLAGLERDEDLIKAKRKFIKLTKAPGGLAIYADAEREASEETQAIRLVLNHMELIAIGIQTAIIDYTLYKRFHKATVLRYWHYSAPFIHRLRTRLDQHTLYHEFQEMVGWMNERKAPRRRRWLVDFW